MDNDQDQPEILIENVILEKLTELFKKNYKPVSTSEGSLLLTTQEITNKFTDILPEINDSQIIKTLTDMGFKTTMIKKSTGFDLYWMLKDK